MHASKLFSDRHVAATWPRAQGLHRLDRIGAALLLAGAAFPLLAANVVVDNLADTGTGSLRQAILAATNGDTIGFAPGLGGTVVLGSPLLLNKNLTIVAGGGIALDGNDAVRVMTVTIGAQVSLRGLVIQHGYAGDGAGIFSEGILTLTDCQVRDNHAFDRGGGILVNNGSYTLDRTWIADNESVGDGGGLMDLGVAASTITASHITGNTSGGLGGGIRHASTFPLTISYSTISGNQVASSSSLSGGGIASQESTLSIRYSTISANKAHFAGGIYMHKFSLPTTLNLTGSLVAGNTANSDGGGIFVFGATLNSLNSTLANNIAGTSTGGGISIQNSAGGTAAATLVNTTVAFNRATVNGGGITLISGGLTLKNSLIAGNVAPTNTDLQGAFISQGFNLVQARGTSNGYTASDLANGSLPNLASLTFNGGPTNTLKLGTGSAAINAIPPGSCTGITLDQRGYRRPTAGCDIGAFEVEGAAILFANGFE